LAYKAFVRKHRILSRVIAAVLVFLLLFAIFVEVQNARDRSRPLELESAIDSLIGKPIPAYAPLITQDEKGGYRFNKEYSFSNDTNGQKSGPKITAAFASGKTGAVTVNDPVNNVAFTLTPTFMVRDPKINANRVIYPIAGKSANAIYSAKGSGIKEDIVLRNYTKDEMSFSYKLGLPEGTEPRIEIDGSLAVYGVSSALLGQVTTSSEQDANLLSLARNNSDKKQLLFKVPAPVIMERNRKVSKSGTAKFELSNGVLTVYAFGLKNAKYPLSIDPSIYVETASKLMRGNNESNADFDTSSELIQKSQTTGARIDNWTSNGNLTYGLWDQQTVAAGGYLYSIGGVEVFKKSFTTQGANTETVPSGATSATIKVWGAGGGGAGGGSTGLGGAGGGGGYVTGAVSVTGGDVLNIYIGANGVGGLYNAGGNGAGGGGSGGGYTRVQRSGTTLLIAGAGGGGGGARDTTTGAAGGAGGGTTAVSGSTVGTGNNSAPGGGAGTPTTGGAGGVNVSGGNDGITGASLTGGAGADGRSADGVDGSGVVGGLTGGGNGGVANINNTRSGGGGGGAGFFGGGGGAAPASATGFSGGGGGGGSSATDVSVSSVTNTAGSGTAPGNSSDTDRAGAGTGGNGGAALSTGSAGTGGRVVIIYTISGSTSALTNKVSWAHLSASNGTIESPNPGNGVCSGWCTNSSYYLPTALKGFSAVSYNGFLYVMGGTDGTSRVGTVYIAKLGANGEPQLWHPSGGTPVYWYTDTGLSSAAAKSYFAAYAYNNRMYVLGGQTNASPNGVTTVELADINPNGTLGSWSTSGMQAIPSGAGTHNMSVHVYNDVMYILGGFEGATTSSANLRSTVYYSKLTVTGAMNPWVSTSAFSSSGARASYGGTYSTVWGGYMYLAGGCTAVNASGYCTTMSSDTILASINADGSLAEWNTIIGLTNQRVGYSFVSWQGGLYRLGGCAAQNASTGVCDSPINEIEFGIINPDGEASTVATSVASGTAPCNGSAPIGCNIPSSGVGNLLNATAVMNGYLYIMGGCTANACGTASNGVMYTAIGSDGSLNKPASCVGTYSDSYCVSSNNLPSTVASAGTAIFNGRLYVVGGWPSVNNFYYTTVNSDGSIGAWSTTTFASAGVTSVSYSFAYARANPASAGSNPGNFYIFGGCTTPTTVSCNAQTQNVYKCTISTAGVVAGCTTTGQLQIGTVNTVDPITRVVTNGAGNGLGTHAGAVYANYIYLIGGLGGGLQDITTIRYAKFNDSNNVVHPTTGLATGSFLEDQTNVMDIGRRRGAAFGYNGYLYVLGGYDAAGGGVNGVLADIEFARINVSNGSWGVFDISSVSINERWGLSVPVSNSYAYVVGGCTLGAAPTSCTVRTNTVQTFQMYNNDSGAIKSFTNASDDTFATATDRWGASSTILNGYLYVSGGCTSSTDCTSAVGDTQYAPISATDGSIGTWVTASGAFPSAAVRTWGKLVNVGGYLYYLGGQSGTATDERSEIFYALPSSNGDISSWSTATKSIGDTGAGGQERTKFGVAVWDGRIYVVGGLNVSSAATSTVFISPQLTSGGDITGNWTSSTAFNFARYGAAVTAYANNLYVFGGNDGTNYLNDSQFAAFGYRTGTFAQSGNTITGSGTTFTSAMVGKKFQYASDSSVATITAFSSATSITVDISRTVSAGGLYTIQDGSVGPWGYTTSLPGLLSQGEAFAANGYMYIIGGRSTNTNCAPNTLIAPLSANTTIATGNNPTGVGEWYETNIRYAGGRYGAAVSYTQGKMYIMGGGCTSPQAASYNTGTISQSTNTVTGSGTNWTENYLGATITYADASTAIITGVNSTTSLTVNVSKTVTAGSTYTITMPRHMYGVVKSQPQIAKYSRMIDTDTDVFPTGWLMNGLDNSIGARWQTKYRSMHDLDANTAPNEDCGTTATMAQMTTWGHERNFGDTALGTVNGYTARNGFSTSAGTITQSGTSVTGSGTSFTSDYIGAILYYADGTVDTVVSVNSTTSLTMSNSKTIASSQTYTLAGGNINCARYYYFSISIDSSQTFGYPDDVTRGPTITDISLFFTADPSKRLRHGKTFTGGEQQPLDTPCRVSGANPGGSQPNCPLP